jgi:hypothetical protein
MGAIQRAFSPRKTLLRSRAEMVLAVTLALAMTLTSAARAIAGTTIISATATGIDFGYCIAFS